VRLIGEARRGGGLGDGRAGDDQGARPREALIAAGALERLFTRLDEAITGAG